MANQFGHIGVRLEDDSQEVVSMPIYITIDDTQTLANIITDAVDLVDASTNVSDCQADRAFLVIELDGFTVTSPAVGSRIESTGLLRTLAPNGAQSHWGFDVPAIKSSTLVAGTKQINLANAGISALVSALTGTTAHGLRPTSPSGHNIDEVVSGRQTFRKHRRVANRH